MHVQSVAAHLPLKDNSLGCAMFYLVDPLENMALIQVTFLSLLLVCVVATEASCKDNWSHSSGVVLCPFFSQRQCTCHEGGYTQHSRDEIQVRRGCNHPSMLYL